MYHKYEFISMARSLLPCVKHQVPYKVRSITPNTMLHRAEGERNNDRAAHDTAN